MAESTRTTKTGKAKSKPIGHRPAQVAGIRARGKKGIPRKKGAGSIPAYTTTPWS